MSTLVRSIKYFPSNTNLPKQLFLLCGFGGSIWQLKRLIHVLNRAGYDVTALDFAKEVLSSGDISLMPKLMDEATKLLEAKQAELDQPVLLVGVSLGALISLNALRRSARFTAAVLITGGDIVKVAQNLYGDKVWPQTYDALADAWRDVNMYTNPALLRGKRALAILPRKDRLIDPEDVRQEIAVQQTAGNDFVLIERRLFGHIGTIIEECVLLPHRTLGYIRRVTD